MRLTFYCEFELAQTAPCAPELERRVAPEPVVLKLGPIEPLGFDGTVSGVRRRSSETCHPYLLSVALGTNGVRQKLGKLRKGSVCL